MLKGFVILLMATDAPVTWSFAELNGACALRENENVEEDAPYETRFAFGRAR